MIPEIVRYINGTVLLGAFTNTAVDKMLLSLLDADPTTRFLRFGRASDSPELAARLGSRGHDPAAYFTEDLARKLGTVAALKRALSPRRRLWRPLHTGHRHCLTSGLTLLSSRSWMKPDS